MTPARKTVLARIPARLRAYAQKGTAEQKTQLRDAKRAAGLCTTLSCYNEIPTDSDFVQCGHCRTRRSKWTKAWHKPFSDNMAKAREKGIVPKLHAKRPPPLPRLNTEFNEREPTWEGPYVKKKDGG